MKKAFLVIVGAVVIVAATTVAVRTVAFQPLTGDRVGKVVVPIDTLGVADRLGGALAIRTITNQDTSRADTSSFLSLHRYLAETYPLVHSRLEVERMSDLSLLFTWAGSVPDLRPMVLMAHMDVVPVNADADSIWTHPPFGGVVANGFVWGRGAADDKVGVVTILEAVESLVQRGFQPKRTVYLAFGHDEEAGGRNGAAVIADTLMTRAKRGLALVLDEGGIVGKGLMDGVEPPLALVGIAEKGYVSLQLSVDSEGGHSSAPPERTAIGVLSRAIQRLESSPFPARIDGASRAMIEIVGREMPLARRMVFANLWLFKPLVVSSMVDEPRAAGLIRTTTAPTMFNAGVRENVLPTSASAVVNFRILPGETVETVVDRVTMVIGDGAIRIEPVNVYFDPSPISDHSSSAFRMIERVINETIPSDRVVVAPYLLPAATDSRYYSNFSPNVFRFRPMMVGAEDLEGIHGVDERISLESLAACVAFHERVILGMQDLD